MDLPKKNRDCVVVEVEFCGEITRQSPVLVFYIPGGCCKISIVVLITIVVLAVVVCSRVGCVHLVTSSVITSLQHIGYFLQ
jgi:hypothetical protein